MRKITPYRTATGAAKAFDNGGRFYNLFTTQGDQVVTRAELTKAAGVIRDDQATWLYFDMAQRDLGDADRRRTEDMLDAGLRDKYRRLRPKDQAPSQFESRARAGESYVVEGHVKRAAQKKHTGFIMVPIMTGSVTTFIMMPTEQVYEVYEVRDSRDHDGEVCVVMFAKGAWLPPANARIRWGGIAKRMNLTKKKSGPSRLYLQPQYYTLL